MEELMDALRRLLTELPRLNDKNAIRGAIDEITTLRTELDEAKAKLALVESADATLHLMAENKRLKAERDGLREALYWVWEYPAVRNIVEPETADRVEAALAAGREEGEHDKSEIL